jgi:NAD+ kinase
MKKRKLVYYPLFPNENDLGAERADYVRKWLDDYLYPRGIATKNEEEANAYLVASGDGGMTKVARSKCDTGRLLLGVNCGTLGFLMNQFKSPDQIPVYEETLNKVEVTLLQGTFILGDGTEKSFLAFNDIFCGGNIADYISFEITGELSHFRNRTVKGNGVFISSPQGTTGFALNARGSSAVLPLDTRTWYIGGVATGPYPDSVFSPQRVTVNVKSRKPVYGYADGYEQEVVDVKKIIVEPTDHKVTLAFSGDMDFEARRRELAQKAELGA